MNPILENLKEKNLKKKVYQRVVSNNMSVVAHKLFKSDKVLHLAFITYRLRRDFGFTDVEVANLTGIPMNTIEKMRTVLKPILESKVLDVLAKMDYQEELLKWDMLGDGHGNKQGYYVIKDHKPWYDDKRYSEKYKEPLIKLGMESEKEYEKKRTEEQSREPGGSN
jgi:hypothetical protein